MEKKKKGIWKRYGKWVVAGIAAVVVAIALYQTFIWYQKSQTRIAVIRVEGVIWSTKYEDLAYEAARDPRIKAVVIEVDSVGGGKDVCFGTELALRNLSRVKPVVVTMKDYGTSGAYLISSPADYIFARGGTTTASFGVYACWICLENRWREEGYEFFVWKSGVAKDAFASYRRPTEEENNYLKELIDSTMEELVSRIKNNRPQVSDEIENMREGWTITGEEARELGFVDKLGDFGDAVKKAAELVGLKKGTYTIVELKAEPHTVEQEIGFINLENRIMLC